MVDPALNLTSGLSLIRRRWLAPEEAVRECVAFEKRFGHRHFRLACHAALPGILGPELLNLIHLNFLASEKIPWIAEADFLLSALCRPIGDGLYEVEPGVREVLLVELENHFGKERSAQVARFLACYLTETPAHWLPPDKRQLLGWIAQAYLNPDRLLAEVQAALEQNIPTETGAPADMAGQLQVATLMEMAGEPLAQSGSQGDYQRLLHDSHVLAQYWYSGDETVSRELAAHPEEYRDLLSPALHNWLRGRPSVSVEIEEPAPKAKEPFQEAEKAVAEGMGAVDKLAIIKIDLSAEGFYEIEGYGFDYRSEGKLWLDIDHVRSLSDQSAQWKYGKLSRLGDLPREIREIGRLIYRLIIEDNDQFKKELEQVFNIVGGLKNCRIIFQMDEPFSTVPWELLCAEDGAFWAFTMPIYQRISRDYSDLNFPLFHPPQDEPINCLIIEAAASGFVAGFDLPFHEQYYLRKETNWLLNFLQDLQQSKLVNIGRIQHLSKENIPPQGRLSEFLGTILEEEGPWHLVHFAGHAFVDQKETKGGVFFLFPRDANEGPELVALERLSLDLRRARTQFLYLSCDGDVRVPFACSNISNLPAVLGFRWPISDEDAFQHARLFYKNLFERKNIAEALPTTRRDLYEQGSNAWAAAVLFTEDLLGAKPATPESDKATPLQEVVQAIDHHLTAIEDGHELLGAVAREVARLIPYDLCTVLVLSADQEHVRPFFISIDRGEPLPGNFSWVALSPDLMKWLAGQNEIILIDDLKTFLSKGQWRALLNQPEIQNTIKLGYRSVIRYPVLRESHVLSVVALSQKVAGYYNEDHKKLLASLPLDKVVLAALEMEKKKEREFQNRLIQEIATYCNNIEEAARMLVDGLADFYRWSNVAFFSADVESGVIRLLYQRSETKEFRLPKDYQQPLEEGVLGYVFRTQEDVRIGDIEKDAKFNELSWQAARSQICLPIKTDEASWLIRIEDDKLNAFAQEDMEASQAVRDQLVPVFKPIIARSEPEITKPFDSLDQQRQQRKNGLIFSLEILRARQGECFFLHYGTKEEPGLILIDGGPAQVYKPHLKPRLREIRKARGFDDYEPLMVELLMVSHIDDDHIRGILELTNELVLYKDEQKPLPMKIRRFWHNSFDDLIGNTSDELLAAVTASFGATALRGEPDTEGLDPDAAMVLASVGQGYRLRDDARRLKLPINPEFGGNIIMAKHGGQSIDMGKGLKLTVVGPMQAELVRLQKDYDIFLKQENKKKTAALAAFTATSVANLSSLVLLAEVEKKRILLTGDARGDNILRGLEGAGLLKKGDKIHVDILKVPHHGSSRFIGPSFFRRITASHYVFSGNGQNGNPEREALQMLLDERRDEEFKMHFTYPIEAIDVLREEDWHKEQQKEQIKKKMNPNVTVREDWSAKQHSLTALFSNYKNFAKKVSMVEEGKPHVINLLDEIGY